MEALQLGLFARGEAVVDERFSRIRRIELGEGAWVEYAPEWLSGHSEVFQALRTTTRWRAEQVPMYERVVAVPRLTAVLPQDGPGHPVLGHISSLLAGRYGDPLSSRHDGGSQRGEGAPLGHLSLAYYRSGRDSVAMHGDRVMRDSPEDTLMATVSLGERRRFLLRPCSDGPGVSLNLGEGDLLVMGGSIQRTHRHGIPKVARAGPRIVCMFRG